MSLPELNAALLVRTSFADDASWQLLCDEISVPSDEGFTANLLPVSESSLSGSSWEHVKAAVPRNNSGSAIVCIADSTTLSSADHPVLIVKLVDYFDEHPEPFRCIPSELWAVENNLNLANMDWDDFANAADEHGVFRGFRPAAPPTPEELQVRE